MKKVEARVVNTVWRFPRILLLRIGRVHRSKSKKDTKLTNDIQYPVHGLDVSDLLSEESEHAETLAAGKDKGDPSHLYDLNAVIHHRGLYAHSGHYYAETMCFETNKLSSGKFYMFDDKKVYLSSSNRATKNIVSSADSYIIVLRSQGISENYSLLFHGIDKNGKSTARAGAGGGQTDSDSPANSANLTGSDCQPETIGSAKPTQDAQKNKDDELSRGVVANEEDVLARIRALNHSAGSQEADADGDLSEIPSDQHLPPFKDKRSCSRSCGL